MALLSTLIFRTEGLLIILVTHLVTISAITNEGASSGEGVLLKLNEDAPYEIVGRLNFGNSSSLFQTWLNGLLVEWLVR